MHGRESTYPRNFNRQLNGNVVHEWEFLMESVKRVPEYLDAKDYRAFLTSLVEGRRERKSALSYGSLALRCGFKSRSFLRDVARGHKRLTLASHAKVLSGLPLPAEDVRFFDLLVQRDEIATRSKRTSPETITKRLGFALERAKNRYCRPCDTLVSTSLLELLKVPEFPFVYAALGDPKHGMPLDAVAARTGLPIRTCEKLLRSMVSAGAAQYIENSHCYVAASPHFVLTSVGATEAFRSLFLSSLDFARVRFLAEPNSASHLFHQSVFSMPIHLVAGFKENLRRVVLEFVEANESPEGECLASITIAALSMG